MGRLPSAVVDRLEQAAALALYGYLVLRIWPDDLTLASLAPGLVLVSEGVIVFFLIIRRPTSDISLRWTDWAVAAGGTIAPLLVVKGGAPISIAVGAFLLLFGLVTQLGAKLSLRRSFGLVAANRGVKTGGAYRYVRHPMYLGYMISHVGFLLLSPAWWNVLVYAAAWTCLILRVAVEERLLMRDAAYRAFAERVRRRLIPGLY
jgi:protein-S-isoprenylcysteine O-methyltransferase Ste14